MQEKGYILTEFAREHGYIGTIDEEDIDDALRGTFTILRQEDVPATPEYIYLCLRSMSKRDVEAALRKLVRAGLVKELE